MILLFALLGCGSPEPPGPSACEVAWTELSTLRDGLSARYAQVRAPDAAAFAAACGALPEQMQRCLSVRYGSQHRSQCTEAASQLDPQQREALERALAP